MDAILLREWLDCSQFHGSIASFARYLGVPPKTAEDWFYRGAKPRGKSKLLLYHATGLTCYAPTNETETRALEELTKADEVKVAERVEQFIDLLSQLRAALDYFKEAPTSARDTLRQELDGPEIAYVANVLQMLLNERRFQDWLTMSGLAATLHGEGTEGGGTREGNTRGRQSSQPIDHTS